MVNSHNTFDTTNTEPKYTYNEWINNLLKGDTPLGGQYLFKCLNVTEGTFILEDSSY